MHQNVSTGEVFSRSRLGFRPLNGVHAMFFRQILVGVWGEITFANALDMGEN